MLQTSSVFRQQLKMGHILSVKIVMTVYPTILHQVKTRLRGQDTILERQKNRSAEPKLIVMLLDVKASLFGKQTKPGKPALKEKPNQRRKKAKGSNQQQMEVTKGKVIICT